MKLVLWMILRSVALLYVLIIVALTVFEGRLIFPVPAGSAAPQTPAALGLAFDDLRIPVDGSSYIHAWWIPAKEPTTKVLLYFHGNAELLEHEVENEVPLLHRTGENLLLVEYRGFGQSSPLQTSGRTTAADALAAMRYLRDMRHVPLSEITICGWSIGSGVAAQLALDMPGAGGLILVSPITSVPDVANESPLFRYLLRPSQWLRHDNDFATKNKIGRIHMPLLLMTGTRDELAPPWMAHLLYDRAPGTKTLHLIEGVDHNSAMQIGNGTVLRQISLFLQR